MENRKYSLRGLRAFDWVLIIGVLTCSISYSLATSSITGGFDWLGTVSAVTGLFCVVLAAHGNILNYFAGVVNVLTYAYISYRSNLLGDCVLNAFYYFPMQFVGWFVWSKRKNSEDPSTVYARTMNWAGRIKLAVISIATVAAFGMLLFWLKSHTDMWPAISRWHLYSEFPFKDSLTTVFAIIAQFLMARAFMEQWFFWIVMDVVSLVIWGMFFAQGTPHSGLMVIMYVFYTANAVNGARIWMKLPRMEKSIQR